MRLKSLSVSSWKRFSTTRTLSFEPGLNLVVGPNESGKSSLVQALRAAFLERYTTGTLDTVRPWGDSSAAPEVSLEFEFEGQNWRLIKRFLQRKRCDLTIGSRQLEGEEAENHLAEWLGYQYSGRGASKPEHWGVPGLLWVDQGTGQDLRTPVSHASQTLQASLSHEVSAVSSTAGDAVLARIADLRDELLTAAGRPRNELKTALEQRDTLQDQCRTLEIQIEQYRQQVDRLTELRSQQEQDALEKPEVRLEADLRQAREQLEQVQRLSHEQQQIQSRLDSLEREQRLLVKGQQQLALQEQAWLQAKAELQTLEAEQQNQQAPQQQIRQDLERARRTLQEWRTLKDQLDAAQQREQLQREFEALQAQHQRQTQQGRDAQAVQESRQKAQAELAQVELKATALKPLQLLEQEIQELQIRLRTAATRLDYRLADGVSLELEGEAGQGEGERLQGEGELRLTQVSRLRIPGLGELRITPGGDDLEPLHAQLQHKQQELARRLHALQIDSVEQGQQRVARTEVLAAQISQLQQNLRSLAPEGLDALQTELTVRDAQLQKLSAQLAQSPTPNSELPPREQAMARLQEAETHLRTLEQGQRELELLVNRHEMSVAAAQRRVSEAQAQWLALRAHEPPEQTQGRLATLGVEQAQLQQQLGELQLRMQQAKPDLLRQDVLRLERSLALLREQQAERREAIIRLEETLRSLGAEGLEERLQQEQARLSQAKARCAQLELRAQALTLLQQRLNEQRETLTRRLQAPLVARMNHYLGLLFDEARAQLNEQLMLENVARRDGQADFDALSFGAREQVGLICRLAYADLLREAGRPTLIVLDDALVHSDRTRLQQMKRVLFDAAQRHQILVFSCHPQDWQDLGVKPQDLAAS